MIVNRVKCLGIVPLTERRANLDARHAPKSSGAATPIAASTLNALAETIVRAGPPVDTETVERLRRQIAEGSYQVDAMQLAESMLAIAEGETDAAAPNDREEGL